MSHIQEYFVPEEIAEASKWTILRHAQVTVSSAIRRRPVATSDEQSSAALLVLRLSLHAEISPCGPQIETFDNGFETLVFCLL